MTPDEILAQQLAEIKETEQLIGAILARMHSNAIGDVCALLRVIVTVVESFQRWDEKHNERTPPQIQRALVHVEQAVAAMDEFRRLSADELSREQDEGDEWKQ